MKKVILGIGIVGSGKTTILKRFAEKYSYKYICPDDIRMELSGNAADQLRNGEVWDLAKERTALQIRNGETVVFDATFARDKERKDFLSFLRENGAEKIQGIFVNTPIEIALQRGKNRERKIPDYVFERMDRQIKKDPPSTTDGFDNLFTLDENGKMTEYSKAKKEGTIVLGVSRK